MIIDLHILQNFAPACLNRDDTNTPKDCEFGGVRRARISSQCLKRAIRRYFTDAGLIPDADLGQRTKRIIDAVNAHLPPDLGDPDTRRHAIARAVENIDSPKSGGLKFKDGKSEYLLYVGRVEVERLAAAVREHFNILKEIGQGKPTGESEAPTATVDVVPGKQAKAKGKQPKTPKAPPLELPKPLKQALDAVLDEHGGGARDVGLFGRMLANLPDRNVDAACQVAHAVSTNRVTMEMDYYTAVDDLKPDDNSGADMIGTVEFNSSCFYRYANIDLGQLARNLGPNAGSAPGVAMAFLRAAVHAIPTGKQNSMAALNPPSAVLVVLRERGPVSLANAFVAPVRPTDRHDLLTRSVEALADYWGRLTAMYGTEGVLYTGLTLERDAELGSLAGSRKPGLAALLGEVGERLNAAPAIGTGGQA